MRDEPKYQNEEIKYLKYPQDAKFTLFMNPGYLFNIHNNSLENATDVELEQTRIKVEKITVPTLLISGEDDLTWPSNKMCTKILEKNKNINWLNYSNVGHIFTIPHIPPLLESKQHSLELGYRANLDVWNKLCNFLTKNLIEV